ncbi:BnaCnng74330D [Brassica napus]|uniref:BnaCnng74330D protein n=1 Tax=Brassica napus TaxID=3708 RepID=A0A078JYN1_BRANA|nr:BnaCnng74330D [Brassica napus]
MSNQQPSQLISLQQDGLYLLDFNKTTSLKLNLPFTLPPPTEPVCILHCRGIMCLTLEGHNDLAIWNPSSKEFKRIMMFNSRQTTNPLGFGYDRFSDDYKIVTIIDRKTFIYTFKEKSWRESVPRDTSLDCKFKNRTGTVEDHCIPVTHQEPFSDKKIKKWQSEPWINMTKHLKEFKNFEVVFACIARNDDVFIVVKDTRNGDGKVMVYKAREKFIEVPFGSSLKGFRCMSDYICQ